MEGERGREEDGGRKRERERVCVSEGISLLKSGVSRSLAQGSRSSKVAVHGAVIHARAAEGRLVLDGGRLQWRHRIRTHGARERRASMPLQHPGGVHGKARLGGQLALGVVCTIGRVGRDGRDGSGICCVVAGGVLAPAAELWPLCPVRKLPPTRHAEKR